MALPSRIHLASRSPRRRELLAQIGVHFDTIAFRGPPREDREIDESAHPGEDPADYVRRVAQAKAMHGWRIPIVELLWTVMETFGQPLVCCFFPICWSANDLLASVTFLLRGSRF